MAKSANSAAADAASVETSPAPAKKTSFPSRIVYLGPSMAEGGSLFTHGQTFNNGLPADWMAKALAEPDFARLLVAVDKTPAAISTLRDPGSMLSAVSRKVQADYLARKEAK